MEPTSQMQQWIWFLFIGGIVGWLAGVIVKGRGFGILGDIIVGVVGAVFGGWLSSVTGLYAYGSFAGFITALIGAVVVVSITRFFKLAV